MSAKTQIEMRVGQEVAKRPESAVSEATGLIGAVTLTVLLVLMKINEVPLGQAVMTLLLGTTVVMVIWDVLIEKVYLNPTTGMDYSLRREFSEIRSDVVTKTVGIVATFGALGLCYLVFKNFQVEKYAVYFTLLERVVPLLILFSPFYFAVTTKFMINPRDKLWHFGAYIRGHRDDVDMEKVKDHIRCWAIKGFFLSFMVSIVFNICGRILATDISMILAEPANLGLFLIHLFFLFDVVFGTIGYAMTFRPLDSHIRSANPFMTGWVAALICYPPISIVGSVLNYREGSSGWTYWFEGMDGTMMMWGIGLGILTMLYAWATVIFGYRFSNLTHRGILTNGPYRFTKHPAYLAKNTFWWLLSMPFLSVAGPETALQNCVLLVLVNCIYFWRAKTEEKHLMEDPAYQVYAKWIDEHGLFAKIQRFFGPKSKAQSA